MNFYVFFSLLKSRKREFTYLQDDVASGASWRTDVARGTTAQVQRGVDTTWQSRGWPTQGAGGAQGADTWQEAKRVHAGPRGRPCGVPCGR